MGRVGDGGFGDFHGGGFADGEDPGGGFGEVDDPEIGDHLVGAGAIDEFFEGIGDEAVVDSEDEQGDEEPSAGAEGAADEDEKEEEESGGSPGGKTRGEGHQAVEEGGGPLLIDEKKELLVHDEMVEGGEIMGKHRQVKTRLMAVALGMWGMLAVGLGEEAPDGLAILKSVRVAQAGQVRVLHGELRNGGKKVPFRLSMDGGVVRYEFEKPPLVLQLRLGEKSLRFEEVTRGGAVEKVAAGRFDQRIGETDLSYEDLALRFLYWPKAEVVGEQTLVFQKCWVVRVEPGTSGESQYGSVKVWIGKESGALMQAEASNPAGQFVRRFKVISGQKLSGGQWILKEMRIEWVGIGEKGDRTPTYLNIDAPK